AKAARLLTDPAHKELQDQIASQIKLLLVDECQDTDPLQVELIQSLCGAGDAEGNLFFVGDYKKSIYRFRGADPSVFLRMQSKTDSGAKHAAREQEAKRIARRIRMMLNEQEKLIAHREPDGRWTARKPEFKDIAILFRALSDVEVYEAALREFDIHYYLVGGH